MTNNCLKILRKIARYETLNPVDAEEMRREDEEWDEEEAWLTNAAQQMGIDTSRGMNATMRNGQWVINGRPVPRQYYPNNRQTRPVRPIQPVQQPVRPRRQDRVHEVEWPRF